jgi:hypothetical protein
MKEEVKKSDLVVDVEKVIVDNFDVMKELSKNTLKSTFN